MRWVALVMGIGFLAWGIWDCITGTSTSGGRFSLPVSYSAKQLGPFFYFLAVIKILAGVYMVWLSLFKVKT